MTRDQLAAAVGVTTTELSAWELSWEVYDVAQAGRLEQALQIQPGLMALALRFPLRVVATDLERIQPQDVADLCDDLQPLLEAFTADGNPIVETSRGWPGALAVWLGAKPGRLPDPPAGVEFRQVGDPHYWHAEAHCQRHDHVLAFGPA